MPQNTSEKRLVGKVAIVTGAGRGIGREHALMFAREGAQVLVNDSGEEDGVFVAEQVVAEIEAAGGVAAVNTQAVGSFEAGQRIVDAAVERFGHLDVLVNNAGILRDRTLLKMTEEEWDAVISVHLKGAFACLQAAARVMKEQATGGRIINTSSSSGLLGAFGQTNYGAAKAAVHSLTRIAAMELAKYDITVNAVAPWAMTRLLATMPQLDPDVAAEALAPCRISPLVVYLATDAAAKVTGQTFGIEGNHLFIYRVMASHGVTRYEQSPWTIEAIEKAIDTVMEW